MHDCAGNVQVGAGWTGSWGRSRLQGTWSGSL
jgi:hypothetical protein